MKYIYSGGITSQNRNMKYFGSVLSLFRNMLGWSLEGRKGKEIKRKEKIEKMEKMTGKKIKKKNKNK